LLTPEEIQSREFLVSLRGYDRDEVHAFLGRVAEQLAQSEARAAQLQQRLDRLKAQQPAMAATAEPSPAAAQSVSPEPTAMFAEIGKETQRILEAAQEAGQQMQRKARQEADRELQSARGQAAKLIAEGERRREHIERIVSELEQRRATMSVQLRGIGRTIEQTLKELNPSEGSATVREAIAADAADTAAADSAAADSAAADTPDSAPADPAQEELADEGAAPPAEEEAAPAAPESPASDAGEQATTDEAPAATAPETSQDNEPAETAQPALAPDEGAADTPAAPAPAEPAGPDTAATEDAPTQTAPAAATEPAITAEPAPPAQPAGAGSGRNDPQGLRAAALSPLHPKLVRKVKRELQEIQNIALDKVRRAKGQGDADDFLPTDDDTSGLGEGATELLEAAWRAGVTSAGVLADRQVDEPSDAPDLGQDFVRDASDRIRGGLSSTLRMGMGAEEGSQGLSDRIGAAFAEFKGAQAEELAATHLIRAYEYGLLAGWSAAGIKGRRWVMGREPRCPEARCRNNDQSGDVAVGEEFPSGHDVPPVHVGCTCTTVPAIDAA
jgi:DivIVA domain-containing protein